jgi:arylsulfatase A-like enzyme
MPATANFFRNGVVFEKAETVRTITTPSYASMLSGLYPYHTGVRNLYIPLHNDVDTLQEKLKREGYTTAGIVSSFAMIGKFSGLNQGFDLYDDFVSERELNRDNYERTAKHTVDQALTWLQHNSKKKPFFLFLHFIDPHGPYHPPDPFRTMFHSDKNEELTKAEIPPYQFMEGTFNRFQYEDWYDGEIAYLDSELKRLYNAFEDAGLTQNSWFLFIADHGESMGEHHIYFGHGHNCYESQSRIPMVWMAPSVLRNRYQPSKDSHVVSVVDVVPTALDALNITTKNTFDGESLLPAMQGQKLKSPIRFIEKAKGDKRIFSAVDGTYKVVKTIRRGNPSTELYDLRTDPYEEKNIAGQIQVPAYLATALDRYIDDSRKYNLPFKVTKLHVDEGRSGYVQGHKDNNQLSDEDREKLKALGYVD